MQFQLIPGGLLLVCAAFIWHPQTKDETKTSKTELNNDTVVKGRQLVEQGNDKILNNSDKVGIPTGRKHALILLNHTSLEDLMKQISALYQVEYEIRGNLHPPALVGSLSLELDLNHMMQVISISDDLKFSIQNNKIIVW